MEGRCGGGGTRDSIEPVGTNDPGPSGVVGAADPPPGEAGAVGVEDPSSTGNEEDAPTPCPRPRYRVDGSGDTRARCVCGEAERVPMRGSQAQTGRR